MGSKDRQDCLSYQAEDPGIPEQQDAGGRKALPYPGGEQADPSKGLRANKACPNLEYL